MSESAYLTRAREWLDRCFGTKPILIMPADEQDLASLLTQVRNETAAEMEQVNKRLRGALSLLLAGQDSGNLDGDRDAPEWATARAALQPPAIEG